MTSRSLKRRRSLWMLIAMLCLLFLTPFTQLSSGSEARHTGTTSVQKDSLTAEIEENVVLNLAELHHFLNLHMEKLSEKPTVNPKGEGLRSVSLYNVLFLGGRETYFCTLRVFRPCTRILSSVRFFIEYIRLLN